MNFGPQAVTFCTSQLEHWLSQNQARIDKAFEALDQEVTINVSFKCKPGDEAPLKITAAMNFVEQKFKASQEAEINEKQRKMF